MQSTFTSDPKSITGDTGEPASVNRKQALLQAVIDEIPDVVVLKDAQGNFLLCNQTVARLYNTTPEAMVGKQDGDFGVPQAIADGFRDNVLGIMARGQTEVVFEDTQDAVSGETRHFKSIKRPFKDAEGCDQILVIAHDITDVVRAQQQVAQSERRLQDVMAATQEGIWDWQVDTGRVVYSERWFGILGFSAGDLPDNVDAFSARIHPDDKAGVWARLQQLVEGSTEVYQSEHRMLCKDGAVIWVHDRGRIAERNAQGHPVRVVGAYADITQRKNDQVALEQALQQAQSATRAKSEFLATMSHELRTPMNGILGMAQLLLLPGIDEADRDDYASTILTSGQSLLALLNDILDLSKIEAGKFQLDTTDLDPQQLLANAQALFSGSAKAKNLTLESQWRGPSGQHYLTDAHRLGQMLANLLGNAIKFTPQGHVRLQGTEIERTGDTALLEFSVRDSGIGIAADKLKLLFLPFSQADSTTTRQFGGSGLGLSIVSRLAAMLGGEVGVESTPGQGSRFWFRVRATLVARQQATWLATLPKAAPNTDAHLSGRVLVAEDNPVNAMVIEALLGQLGLVVTLVGDGQLALDAISQGSAPDVVLMDLQMPVMDGLAATRHIRQWEADHAQPRLPIIALTADAFEEDRKLCLAAGMDDFLSKPIALEALKKALAPWLDTHLKQAQAVSEPVEQPLDRARFEALVYEITPLLALNRFNALACFKDIVALTQNTDLAPEIARIDADLKAFSFDLVLQQLQKLTTPPAEN